MSSPGDEYCSCEIDRYMHSNMYECLATEYGKPRLLRMVSYQSPDHGNSKKRTYGRIRVPHNVFAFL
jgi:hypothetical protein